MPECGEIYHDSGYVIRLQLEIKDLEEENRKLKERIRFLEQCLDNKEKVNKSLREELEKLKVKYGDLDY